MTQDEPIPLDEVSTPATLSPPPSSSSSSSSSSLPPRKVSAPPPPTPPEQRAHPPRPFTAPPPSSSSPSSSSSSSSSDSPEPLSPSTSTDSVVSSSPILIFSHNNASRNSLTMSPSSSSDTRTTSLLGFDLNIPSLGLPLKPSKEPVFNRLMVNYGTSLCLTAGATAACLFISYAASKLQYRVYNPTPTSYFNPEAFTQIVILFLVFGLLLFTVFQFYVFNGRRELAEPKYVILVFLAFGKGKIFIGTPLISNHYGFPYYYYLIDVILIFVVFCGLCFMIGYFSKGEGKSLDSVLQNTTDSFSSPLSSRKSFSSFLKASFTTATLLTQLLVSVTALAYGMFLVMCYSSLSDGLKIFWRLVVHPLYFEIFMMLPVRYLVQRKMKGYAEKNILFSLSVVHAQSRRMMFSTLDNIGLAVFSILMLNVGKFFFRLSSPLRDVFIQKIFDVEVNEQVYKARLERQRYIAASAIQTEMVVENSCAIFAGFTMYFFQPNRHLFTFPYPSDDLSIANVFIIFIIQIAFALVFDSTTLYVAQKYLQLPIIRTWEDMWKKKVRFFGFLLYGLVTMGLIGIFYMGIRVPRVVFCSNQSVCSCVWIQWMDQECLSYVQSLALH